MAITLDGSNGITTDIASKESATFNRDTTDGELIILQKDNSTIGSIGVVNNNNPFISNDADNSGLQFGTNQIIPHYDNLQRDNAVDLGSGSVRFKDLYLSGGVYLGGTGAANYLDDYEEGTFTPTAISGFTVTSGTLAFTGYYIKIGNLVKIFIAQTSGVANLASVGQIGGLPFQANTTRFKFTGAMTNSGPSIVGVTLPWASNGLYYKLTAGVDGQGHTIYNASYYVD